MKYNYLSKFKSYTIVFGEKVYVVDRKQLLAMILMARDKMIKEKKIAVIAAIKENTVVFYNDKIVKNKQELLNHINSFDKEGFELITTDTRRSLIIYEKNRQILYK